MGDSQKGGRGGDVYHVTNLNDDGAGSLRFGISSASGPRTIIFDVSGTIQLSDVLEINEPYLTITGQTAPGDGICLRDHSLIIKNTHDVIIRYIRIRNGDKNKGTRSGEDTITTNDVSNIIFDHISASWGIDGIHDLRRGKNFTLQWSIYAEPLHNSIHYEEVPHGKLGSMRDLTGNISLHHNVLASSTDRHPSLGGSDTNNIVDFRNYLLFNWKGGTNLGGSKTNVINNYYKPGNVTDESEKPLRVKAKDPATPTGFLSGNVFPWNREWTNDNFDAVKYCYGGKYMCIEREPYELPGELVFGDDKLVTQTAAKAYDLVLQYAGASKVRDAADSRLINGIKDGTNDVIDSQDEVGGWPVLETLPAPADTDRDGMADEWEIAIGLDPTDADDRNDDRNDDGFTNLEEYINSLAEVHTGKS